MEMIFKKQEAARALKISQETLDKYKDAGKLSYHKIGRRVIFTESDLTTFLERCSIPATASITNREKKAIESAIAGVKNENSD
jgi:excisionase family DNA binding protein